MSPDTSAIMDTGSMQTMLNLHAVENMELLGEGGAEVLVEFGNGNVVSTSQTAMLSSRGVEGKPI